GINAGFIYYHPAAFPKRRNTKAVSLFTAFLFHSEALSLVVIDSPQKRIPCLSPFIHTNKNSVMVGGTLIQDSKLHTVIKYIIPNSPVVQVSPYPVKAVIGQRQGKVLLFLRWFFSGNIHRRLLTQGFHCFRISHPIDLPQKPEG